jgi:hypothetical protein
MSNLYATGDPTIKASAVVAWNMPSPVNPYDFSEFFLAGLWLLVTGWLIVRSGYFAPVSGYIALIGGIGLIVLFIGTVTGTEPLILATGAPGALIVAPVFWLWIGYTLWTKS